MGTIHQLYPVRNNFEPDRLFNVISDGWYVEIREGAKGPFLNREDAEKYLESLKNKTLGRRANLWKKSGVR